MTLHIDKLMHLTNRRFGCSNAAAVPNRHTQCSGSVIALTQTGYLPIFAKLSRTPKLGNGSISEVIPSATASRISAGIVTHLVPPAPTTDAPPNLRPSVLVRLELQGGEVVVHRLCPPDQLDRPVGAQQQFLRAQPTVVRETHRQPVRSRILNRQQVTDLGRR